MDITKEESCRICGGGLSEIISLGSIFPSGFIKGNEEPKEEDKAPLVLVRCNDCGLVQLQHTINLDLMYRQYWYSSSLNKSMVTSLKDVVDDIESKVHLSPGDTVVDIGCNDGTLLNLYNTVFLNKVGYDPALNLAKPENVDFINDYFTSKAFNERQRKKAKVVTAIAMFYDLPDPNRFVQEVKEILDDRGIFVIQFTDLLSMINATAFDNICHEHLEYYRATDVQGLLERNGLQVIDISYNTVNGGSVRITAAHKDKFATHYRVENSLEKEKAYLSENGFDSFIAKIETIKFKTFEFIKDAKRRGQRIHLLGASTKGNTLLQVFGIDNSMIDFAAEVNPDKFGLRTVGSNIEIIPETDSLIKHPNYYLVPIWHFKSNLLSNTRILDYLHSGGKLLFPLPEFTIVSSSYGNKITETRI